MMNRIAYGVLLYVWIATAVSGWRRAGKEKARWPPAEKWDRLVDGGQTRELEEAAEYFRNCRQASASGSRRSGAWGSPSAHRLMEVDDRHLQTAQPGGADGEYVVVTFETSFENKKTAIETVTPMMDKDGTWRVSGYFIK
jgi:hypothetical protein